MKRILLLGHGTYLGQTFARFCLNAGHGVFGIDDAEELPTPFPPFFDWIVSCAGRNHLAQIGNDYRNGTKVEDGQMLIDNVMPIYDLMSLLVRERHPPVRVLAVASQTYRIPQTNTAIYCASKAALVQLVRTMARELAPEGWVLNCIAPGKIVDTRMAEQTDKQVRLLRGWTQEDADRYALRSVPMRRFTTCLEVAEAMVRILEFPTYINGACIDMTGGA